MRKPTWIVFDVTGVLYSGGKPMEQMWQLVSDLKKRGYKLAVCTNLILKDNPQFEIFDKIIDGSAHRSSKPSFKVFEAVEKELNASGNQIFYIDDFEINTQTARDLFDWQVYTFGNVEEIRKILFT